MIDHKVLKELLQDELVKLGLTDEEEDRLVDELNRLAWLLTEAAQEQHKSSTVSHGVYTSRR